MDYILDFNGQTQQDENIRRMITTDFEERELAEIRNRVEDMIHTFEGVSDVPKPLNSSEALDVITGKLLDPSVHMHSINSFFVNISNVIGQINPNNSQFSGLSYQELVRKLEREEIEKLEIMRIAMKEIRDAQIEEEVQKFKNLMI